MKISKYLKRATALTAAAAISVTTVISASAAEDPTFFDKAAQYDVNGNKPGYVDVSTMSGGSARQAFYKKLYDACVEVWNNSADLQAMNMDGYTVYPMGMIPVTDLLPDFNADSASSSDYNNAYKTFFEVMMPFAADNPIFYFIDTYNVGIARTSDGKDVYVLFVWDENYASGATRAQYQAKIKEFFSKAPEVVEGKKTLAAKHAALQKYLSDNMTYSSRQNMDKAYSHNIVGPAVFQEGVCESYARSYGLLCNLAGLECLYVDGYVENADMQGNPGGHAWDTVKLDDGNYYGIDVTWDDGNGENIAAQLADDPSLIDNLSREYALNYVNGYLYYEFGTGRTRFGASHTENNHDTPTLLGDGYENWFLYAVDTVAGVVRKNYDFCLAGDVNNDFEFDMRDLIRLGKYTTNPSNVVISFAPANADGVGEINMTDAVYLQKSLLGYEENVPKVDNEKYPSRT